MKPFVAIDGVLDYLFFIIFRCISVENCAQTENLCCRLEAVLGPVFLSLEQVRADNSGPCVAHNRRPKCTTLLPLELHFLPSLRRKYYAYSATELKCTKTPTDILKAL